MRDLVRILLVMFGACGVTAAQQLEDLRVGHWVEIKGERGADGRFTASGVEVLEPTGSEVIIGLVESVDATLQRFSVLGQVVHVSDKTEFKDIDFDGLDKKRVKVDGHFRSASKFSARKITARGEGRDRIGGRIDKLQASTAGFEAAVMGFRVWIPRSTKLENVEPFTSIPLAPEVEFEIVIQGSREADDYIPGRVQLLENLYLGGLVEFKTEFDGDHHLDNVLRRDVWKNRLTTRLQFLWTPTDKVTALFTPRLEGTYRWDEAFSDTSDLRASVHELWTDVRDVGIDGLGLRIGRQEYADEREWLFKRNLDAIRATWRVGQWKLEATAARPMQQDTSDFNTHADTFMLYGGWGTPARSLAAYVVDRRDDRSPRDYPIHFGVRALGDWIPGANSWAEYSIVRGYDDSLDLKGHGFDVGTSWHPPFTENMYLIGGLAFGSGDRDSTSNTNEDFRQTGLQKNNDKLGGVTSYRYYGEVVDPELSNLRILTLGIGTRIGRKNSIDLLWHSYEQDSAADFLRDSNLRALPDGVHRDLGQEWDIVLGTRAIKDWDFEFVLGWFEPGDAFPAMDSAWIATIQAKFRF